MRAPRSLTGEPVSTTCFRRWDAEVGATEIRSDAWTTFGQGLPDDPEVLGAEFGGFEGLGVALTILPNLCFRCYLH
jgi:hypothetical protein